MKLRIDRRHFALQSTAALGGLMLIGNGNSFAEDANIRDRRLIELGLNAMSRAAEMNYFNDGHRGAAMISAHYLCTDNDLNDQAAGRIVQLFELNWAKSKLCEPFPEADPDPNAIARIGTALADGGSVLREVGHNVIFASLAIKAFRAMPELATRERVEGVCNLIRSFKPWRDIEPDANVDPPPFEDQPATARFILTEVSAAIERFQGFGQGFAGHMLTFGQAVVELAAMGDIEWAESCRTAFRKYVTVTRLGPDANSRKIPDHKPNKLRPKDPEYWEKRGDKTLGIGHVFKYPYGYYDLLAKANAPELSTELDAKAYALF